MRPRKLTTVLILTLLCASMFQFFTCQPVQGGTNTIAKSEEPKTDDGQIKATYHGNQRSHVFHRSSCMHFNCPNCVVVFNSRKAAMEAGFRPCKLCNP